MQGWPEFSPLPLTKVEREFILKTFAPPGILGGYKLERYDSTVRKLEWELRNMVTKEYVDNSIKALAKIIVRLEDRVDALTRKNSVREAELQTLRLQVLGIAVDVCDKLNEMEETPLYQTQQIALRLLAAAPEAPTPSAESRRGMEGGA